MVRLSFLRVVSTDLIQAKILKCDIGFGVFKFLFYFIKSRTCRVHVFVRLRSENVFFSYFAKVYLKRYFIEVGRSTVIGEYFWMPHPRCIILAGNAVIGKHVHVGQYVTVGGSFKKIQVREDGKIQKLPIIGDRVVILSGAVIGGPVMVGSEVIVGANAVVTKDVESNSICFGQNQLAKKKIRIPECGREYQVMRNNQ